jgi:uncharacterized membrane protein YcaP (DUF421 family)
MPDFRDMLLGEPAGWVRTLLVGVSAYVALVLLLRISGKRTLSKMNAFDFVVTVALGSTLATVLLNQSVSLLEGVLAFGLLIGMQYLVTFLSVRSRWVAQSVKSEPALLLYDGQMLAAALKAERVTEGEVLAAVRAAQVSSLQDVKAVILETDGSLSVTKHGDSAASEPPSALANLDRVSGGRP